jgi:release factor glutamine methyltransferase
MALTDGSPDGLDSIRAIVAGAAGHLEPGGWLVFEHGYDQREAARALLEDAGFTDIVMIDDLAGVPRVAGGKMRSERNKR